MRLPISVKVLFPFHRTRHHTRIKIRLWYGLNCRQSSTTVVSRRRSSYALEATYSRLNVHGLPFWIAVGHINSVWMVIYWRRLCSQELSTHFRRIVYATSTRVYFERRRHNGKSNRYAKSSEFVLNGGGLKKILRVFISEFYRFTDFIVCPSVRIGKTRLKVVLGDGCQTSVF